jgi:hypothetical protein
VKFKDTHGDSIINLGKRDRAKILEHLGNASATVSDTKHPLHAHLRKAAGELGAIVDRSEDDGEQSTPHDRNLTSGGMRSRLSTRPGVDTSAEGSSEIASRAAGGAMDLFKSLARGERATFEIRRAAAVRELYKRATTETNKLKKAALERVAFELDRIDGRDVESSVGDFSKSGPAAAVNHPLRSWGERHGF